MEQNVIHLSTLEEDLKTIQERIDKNPINPESVAEFTTLIPSGNPEEEKTPSYITINMLNTGNIPINFCGSLELENGKKLIVYSVPIKRPGSEITGNLFFAKDPEATEALAIQRNGEYDYDESEAYVHLKDGTWKEMFVNLILWRGSAEEGGVWAPLLSVVKGSWTDYSVDAGLLVSWQTINPDTGEMVRLGAEDEREYLDRMERIIFPAVSVGVIY